MRADRLEQILGISITSQDGSRLSFMNSSVTSTSSHHLTDTLPHLPIILVLHAARPGLREFFSYPSAIGFWMFCASFVEHVTDSSKPRLTFQRPIFSTPLLLLMTVSTQPRPHQVTVQCSCFPGSRQQLPLFQVPSGPPDSAAHTSPLQMVTGCHLFPFPKWCLPTGERSHGLHNKMR